MLNVSWILNSDSMTAIPHGLSEEYLIPKGFVNNLKFSSKPFRLFVIERQEYDRLIAILVITGYQNITDGQNFGDYLLSCDLYKSIRICNRYIDSTSHQIDSTKGLSYGLTALDEDVSKSIIKNIITNTNIQYNSPTDSYLSRAAITAINSRKIESIAKEAIKQVITKYTLSEIWSDTVDFNKMPVSYFAYKLICQYKSSYDDILIKNELSKFDPFNSLTAEHSDSYSIKAQKNSRFDSNFIPININDIKNKKYTSSDRKIDVSGMLLKTEEAYKRHQDILRDLCIYLSKKSFQPYQTNSVDLMYEAEGKIIVIEIKSSSLENIFSQIASGVVQLGYYANCLSEDYFAIDTLLIVEKISDDKIMSEALSSLYYFKIPHFVYDRNKKSEERWAGLPGV